MPSLKEMMQKDKVAADTLTNAQTPQINEQKIERYQIDNQDVAPYVQNVAYRIENGAVIVTGNCDNIGHLMPRTTEKDGKVQCGFWKGPNRTGVEAVAKKNVRTTVLEHEAYKHMQKRAAQGETLGDAEKAFMQKHEVNLEKCKLAVNKDGSLRQTEPNMLQMNYGRSR